MMILSAIARGVGAGIIAGGGGSITVSSELYSTTAPVVSVTTTQDLLPTVGVQTTTSFSSTQAGHWEVASDVPGATISQASDGLSATITWTPQSYPVCSIYIAARCANAGGSSVAVCRAHPGMRGVVQVGTGGDYANLHAAFSAVQGFANPGGYAFVVKNGTYTADNMHIYYDGSDSGVKPETPPCGEYTETGSAPDKLFTITRFTSVIAETPFGVVWDGQGTRNTGCYMRGNTPQETDVAAVFGAGTPRTAAGSDLRGIHISGFVAKDMDNSGFGIEYCDNIFLEYFICGEVSRITPNQNNPGINFTHSKDCLGSNLHSFGGTRYNESTYIAKRIQLRRTFGRKDIVKTSEPHGGVTFYRSRYCRSDNHLQFDSDQLEEFDTSPSLPYNSIDAGVFVIAATGATDFPRDIAFNRGLMFNCRMGLSTNDAYDTSSSQNNDFPINDCGAWYYKPDDKEGSGSGIGTWGPTKFNNFTSVYCDNVDSTYGANTWRRLIDVSDSVIYNYGHQYDGAGRGVNTFGYTLYADNYFHLTNVTLYGLSVATEIAGDATYYVKTNVDASTDPTTQGMRYPGRLEPGSAYKTSHRGQDNWYKSVGYRGYKWGQTDYAADVGRNWLAEGMIELALPHYRAYSYTGSTNTLGTQTLSGDRGGAQTTRGLIDYIISAGDRDVPFPLSTHIQTISGGHRITVRQFASYYMTNITSFKLYQNGTLFHTSTTKNMHGFDVTGLTSGASITITAVDSVHGESGHSYAVTVP